jgi:MFS family permease
MRARLGGAARLRVAALFACVLALNTADLASLGAVAGRLKPALHLDNTQLGVLAAAPSLVAALATLPMGVLADRARRVPWLAGTVAVWSGAMVLAGACGSFDELLVVRLFLGAVTAASGPLVASLVGDLFWPGERGRIYGYILAGELLGAGFGLLVSGSVAGLSWRAALWVLALPSVLLAAAIWRVLEEPARGGSARLTREGSSSDDGSGERSAEAGERSTEAGERSAETGERSTETDGRGAEEPDRRPAVQRAVAESDASPRRELVLVRDPVSMPIWRAFLYVLRVPTNVRLIVASALGYFFQADVNTFGVVFVIASFDVSQPVATWLLAAIAIGALLGTVYGGRLADALLGEGQASARMLVAGVAFIVSSAIFVPGLLSRDLAVAMPLYVLAAAALGAPNAPVDAARLDIMPSRLWGRAEAIRSMVRTLAIAAAPLLFGFLSDELSPGSRATTRGLGYHASGAGLRDTFLLMLAPMALGGAILLWGARGYRQDVATAMASEERLTRAQARA